MKLSVVIPVYNVPPELLAACLKSVMQNLRELDDVEVLLVNDGSTEPWIEAMLMDAARQDTRCRYVLKMNGGLPDARNKGIELAQGEYIVFLDADDYIEPDALAYMLTKTEEAQADMSAFGYCDNDEARNVPLLRKMLSAEEIRDFVELLISSDYRHRYYGYWLSRAFAWAKVYRRSIICDRQIRFDPKTGCREDVDFNLQYLRYTERVYVDNRLVYHYVDNAESIMRRFSRNVVPFLPYLLEKWEQAAYSHGIDKGRCTMLLAYRTVHEIRVVRNTYFTHPQNPHSFWQLKAEMTAFLSEPAVRKWICRFRLRDARDKVELKNVILLKLRLYWLYLLTERRKRRKGMY